MQDLALGEPEMMEIDYEPSRIDKPNLHNERLPIDTPILDDEPPDDELPSGIAPGLRGEPTSILSRRNRLPNSVAKDTQVKEYGCDTVWLDKI
ncbi:unnamed protein product [Arabis nemorensis]|uniref:Uncharacterized protein n=1 Tax=Arabis nemorensis TaxID=586526 RepID=A0A565BI37_9BRAS|nr:unnamed protein product [Arabis nemorensis]